MTDRWTQAEIDTLNDMMADGKGYGEIAKALNRTKWAVRSRWAKVVRAMGWQAQ